jgi:hypothetical protein
VRFGKFEFQFDISAVAVEFGDYGDGIHLPFLHVAP